MGSKRWSGWGWWGEEIKMSRGRVVFQNAQEDRYTSVWGSYWGGVGGGGEDDTHIARTYYAKIDCSNRTCPISAQSHTYIVRFTQMDHPFFHIFRGIQSMGSMYNGSRISIMHLNLSLKHNFFWPTPCLRPSLPLFRPLSVRWLWSFFPGSSGPISIDVSPNNNFMYLV